MGRKTHLPNTILVKRLDRATDAPLPRTILISLQDRIWNARPKKVLSDWFVVRVHINRERWARRHIVKKGYRVFIPYLVEDGFSAEKAMFPGYIFVEGKDWSYLHSTPGCIGPVMMGDTPGYVPIREMKVLIGAADDEGRIVIGGEVFKIGQSVRVKRGPFKNLWGVYTGQVRGAVLDRVRVLFSILSGDHELAFNRTDVTVSKDETDQLRMRMLSKPSKLKSKIIGAGR